MISNQEELEKCFYDMSLKRAIQFFCIHASSKKSSIVDGLFNFPHDITKSVIAKSHWWTCLNFVQIKEASQDIFFKYRDILKPSVEQHEGFYSEVKYCLSHYSLYHLISPSETFELVHKDHFLEILKYLLIV